MKHERFQLLKNYNWKGYFKEGHIYIDRVCPSLKGCFVKGINDKNKLTTLFILDSDLEQCEIIHESKILEKYITNEMKGNK